MYHTKSAKAIIKNFLKRPTVVVDLRKNDLNIIPLILRRRRIHQIAFG